MRKRRKRALKARVIKGIKSVCKLKFQQVEQRSGSERVDVSVGGQVCTLTRTHVVFEAGHRGYCSSSL